MKMFRNVIVNLLAAAGLCFMPLTNVAATDLQVYKGQLRILVPDEQLRDSLLVQYRSKTREVVRIGISGLSLTNTETNEVTRLPDHSAGLENRIDHDGFWNTDILYEDLNLGGENYRIEGILTLNLVGSQRTRNFSVYLHHESSKRPPDSSIDWGISN